MTECKCCKECTKREIGCHSSCKEYKEWVEIHEKERREIKALKEIENNIWHKAGLPGICFGNPPKRRVHKNKLRG